MMKQITLPGIKETGSDFIELENRIKAAFAKLLYIPLFKSLEIDTFKFQNSKSSDVTLTQAIRSGRVWYEHGGFSGSFNANISRQLKEMGATWDKKINSWRVVFREVPIRYRELIEVTYEKNLAKVTKASKELAQISPAEIARQVKSADLFNVALWKTDERIAKTLKGITIEHKLTDEQRAKISEEWQHNMDLYITKFAEEEIPRLRSEVQSHILGGGRYEAMVPDIMKKLDATLFKSYESMKKKAKFLARQETGLLMTKFREIRYTSAGVHEYKWRCVTGTASHPVRPRHKQLNDQSLAGKIFRWDDPPIVTEPGEPVRKANAGADFNCRCIALPVVRFIKETK
jgi:SPP1 gp7 family putative phage head morphogenesis protein